MEVFATGKEAEGPGWTWLSIWMSVRTIPRSLTDAPRCLFVTRKYGDPEYELWLSRPVRALDKGVVYLLRHSLL